MAVHSIKAIQNIPASLEKVWDFFSSADNLQAITPDFLRFKTISKHHGQKIYAGQIIEYTIRPVLGIPLYWMTEITHVQENIFFADEQRFGPYRLWHHQHHFKTIENGIEMTDIVHYKLPLGWLGDIAHAVFVRRQLNEIFHFRYKQIEEVFGGWSKQQPRIELY